MLEEGTSVNASDYDSRTALHVAAAEGEMAFVEVLVAKGANINAKDRWGGTPLDDAVLGQRDEVAEYLRLLGAQHSISLNKRLNAPGGLGEGGVIDPVSPVALLLQSAAEGKVDAIRQLLEDEDVSPNASDYDKRTAAHLAASEGHLEVLRLLVSIGANINPTDRWGHTPMQDALRAGHPACAEFLGAHGGTAEDSHHMLKDSSPEEIRKLQQRGSAEKWAIYDREIFMEPEPFAKGSGGELYRIKWRGMVCVAKTCSKMATSSQSLHDLGNEISLMATLRHPHLVMFLGACFTVSPPILADGVLRGRHARGTHSAGKRRQSIQCTHACREAVQVGLRTGSRHELPASMQPSCCAQRFGECQKAASVACRRPRLVLHTPPQPPCCSSPTNLPTCPPTHLPTETVQCHARSRRQGQGH